MISIDQEKASLEDELTKLPPAHDCSLNLEIRLRAHEGSPKEHYVRQCLICGNQKGSPIKEVAAQKELHGHIPEKFDFSLENLIQDRRRQIFARIESIKSVNPTVQDAQSAFLKNNEEWEGFAKDTVNAAVEALLPRYGKKQIINIISRNLAPLRKELQDLRTSKVNRFTSEDELKNWINVWLSEDFWVHKEVTGRHVSSNVNVVIDYVLYPKAHLLEQGFIDGYVGVEVKYINQENGFSRKASRGIWQTISYTDSIFALNGKETPLSFAVLFSNLSFLDEQNLLKITHAENDLFEWRAMLRLANHANVGTFEMLGERDNWRGWRIIFATGSAYFIRSNFNGKPTYRLSNKNLVEKVRVGNF